MKKIASIIIAMFMGIALAISGGVLLSGCASKDRAGISQEETVDQIQTDATLPSRSSFDFNLNGGTSLVRPRTYQISDFSLINYGYGFQTNSYGYLESQNKGIASSYSMLRIQFLSNTSSSSFTIRYISYGENNYDYAIFSNIDQTLSSSNTADSTYYKRTYGESSSAEKSITYSNISSGTHYIYVKYIKDGSANVGDDTLQLFFDSDVLPGSSSKYLFLGMQYGTLPTAYRQGYSFGGWYTSASGGELVTEYSIYSSNQTLYARWEGSVPYEIYFNENYDGSTVNLYHRYMGYIEGNLTENSGRYTSKVVSGNEYGWFKIQKWENGSWAAETNRSEIGVLTHTIEKTVSNTYLRVGFNGSTADACITIDLSSLQNGTYVVSAELFTFPGRSPEGGTFGNIKIEKGGTYTSFTGEGIETYAGMEYTHYYSFPTPTRTGYTFNGWYRKKNYLNMDAMMAFLNRYNSDSAKVDKGSDGVYSWQHDSAREDDHYRIFPVSLTIGATYRLSFMARSATDGGSYSTSLTPINNDFDWYANGYKDCYVIKDTTWRWYETTFTVDSTFAGFSCGWWDGGRAYFKNIRLERMDTSDFETKVSTGDTQPLMSAHTLYASWSANTYTVTFNGNGATSGSMSNRTWTYDNWYSVSNGFSKDGYSFAGWSISTNSVVTHYYGSSTSSYSTTTSSTFTDSNTGTRYYKNLKSVSGTVTFTAQWKANPYTVTFNANGGSVSPTSKSVTFNSSYGTLPTATRTYYVQNGWWTAASGGTRVYDTTTYSTAGNQTLYAQWKPASITNTVHLRVINMDGTYSNVDDNAGGQVEVTRNVISGSTSSAETRTQTEKAYSYVCHAGNTFTLKGKANSGYAYVGTITKLNQVETIKNPTTRPLGDLYSTNSTTSEDYYVYFKQLSGNQLKYDETDKYFYFEDGYYPQSDVNSALKLNMSSSQSGVTASYDNQTNIMTLNGTMTGHVMLCAINMDFKTGQDFRLSVEHLSGEVNCSAHWAMVLEASTSPTEFFGGDEIFNAGRNYCEVTKGNGVSAFQILQQSETYGKYLTFYIYRDADLTFNNAKYKLTITPDFNNWLNTSATATGESLNFNLAKGDEWVATGSNHYFIDKSKGFTDKLTVSLWAYKDNWNITSGETIISWTNDGGWNFQLNSGGAVGYLSAEAMMLGDEWNYTSIKFGKLSEISSGWHMLTMTFDGRYMKSYTDGNLIETIDFGANSTIRPEGFGADIVVGAECGYNYTNTPDGNNFHGKVRDVKIENEALSASQIEALFNDNMQIPVYSLNGEKYVKVTNNGRSAWFKFEPIRWRVSDYGVENSKSNFDKYSTLLKFKNYASYSDNFMAVSDLILGVGSMHSTRVVSEGDKVEEMAGFQNIQNMANDLTPDTLKTNYNRTGNLINIDSYSGYGSGQTNAVNKNNTTTYSAPFRICSLAELNEMGFVNKQAKASDMVAFILGLDKNQVSYWTRDLSNLGAGVAITPTGTQIRPWLDEVLGIRFTYTFLEGSCAF